MVDVEELIRELVHPDPKVRADAAQALGRDAAQGTNISAAIPALAKALSDRDKDVRWHAAGALKDAVKCEGVHMTGDMSAILAAMRALVKYLYDGDAYDRAGAAEILGYASLSNVGIGVAIPALAETLSDGDAGVRLMAVGALKSAAMHGADISAAIAALAAGLFDDNCVVVSRATDALRHESAIGNCDSVEALERMEANLRKGYDASRKRYKYGKEAELASIGSVVSGFMGKTAKRRDALAAKRDILLDDLPKPPKRGGVYQGIRGVVGNG
jgi:HEAT repeat protein